MPDASTDVSRKDIILEPATENRKSNIEEYEKKLLAHVGDKHPHCATCFELYTHDENGLTMKDFELSDYMDKVYEKLSLEHY